MTLSGLGLKGLVIPLVNQQMRLSCITSSSEFSHKRFSQNAFHA